jgi:hypothetical protein
VKKVFIVTHGYLDRDGRIDAQTWAFESDERAKWWVRELLTDFEGNLIAGWSWRDREGETAIAEMLKYLSNGHTLRKDDDSECVVVKECDIV